MISPIQGVITQIYAVIDNPIVGADLVYTFSIGGVNITPATMTFTLAGSAQGDTATIVTTATNIVTNGGTFEIDGNGGNTDPNVSTNFQFVIRRG
jgi:hypothetical protein